MEMFCESFDCLLREIGPHVMKTTTNMKDSIIPEEILARTPRFLASGESQQSLGFSFVSVIIR